MNEFEYYSVQTYSYQDLKSLKKILKVDSIGLVNLFEDEQIIEYDINRSRCLRLSDFISLISLQYLKIHLGQLLILFLDLLKKVKFLQEQHSIEHQYLDENRIWLVFDPSKRIDVINTQIEYSIAFTGYQCQLYEEDSNIIIPGYQKIQIIIKRILNLFKNQKFFISSQKEKDVECIYEQIITLCDRLNIQDTINIIIEILQKQKYDSQAQTIVLDNSSNKKRYTINLLTQRYMQGLVLKIIKHCKEESQHVLEAIIQFKIPFIVNNLDQINLQNTITLFKDDLCEELKPLKQTFARAKEILEKKALTNIQQFFNDTFYKYMEDFKFDIQEEDKKQIIDSTFKRVLSMRLNKYFYNSHHYFIKTNQTINQQLSLINRLAQEILNEEISIFLQYKILLLIDELI